MLKFQRDLNKGTNMASFSRGYGLTLNWIGQIEILHLLMLSLYPTLHAPHPLHNCVQTGHSFLSVVRCLHMCVCVTLARKKFFPSPYDGYFYLCACNFYF